VNAITLSNASTNGARVAMGMDKKTTAASTTSEAPAWAKRTMQRAASMHHSIPQEAQPSGGNINASDVVLAAVVFLSIPIATLAPLVDALESVSPALPAIQYHRKLGLRAAI
jgi:hypothetical protein